MDDTDRRRRHFEELFRAFHPAVLAFVRRRAAAESVDDVVADTFLVVWRRLDEVPEAPLPWLLTVARNVIGTEYRGRKRRLALWARAQAEFVEGHDPHAREEWGRLPAALARLGERDREALMLVGWDGLTPSEAAAVLGVPAPRFRQRLHRATRRLRGALAAEDEAEPAVTPSSLNASSKGAPA